MHHTKILVMVMLAVGAGSVARARGAESTAAQGDPGELVRPATLPAADGPVCEGSATPEGEPTCFDGYVDNFNGGLNSTPNTYSPISCGESVCGTTGTFLNAGTPTRDTDWYLLSIPIATQVTWTATAAGFPHAIAIVDPGTGTIEAGIATSVAGETISVSATLGAGDWALFVSTANFSGVPCGVEYGAAVTCATPIGHGACCLPDGTCRNGLAPTDCEKLGGLYQGDNQLCEGSFQFMIGLGCAEPFEDIGAIGTVAPNASGFDDAGDVVPIGFAFPFFGALQTEVGIASNGYLTFGGNLTEFTNDPCPDVLSPNSLIAPCWDDWSPDAGGDVRYLVLGTPGVDLRLVVQWTDVPHFGGGLPSTFQAVLYEDGTIAFRYLVLDPARTATVGVENDDASESVCYPPDSDTCLRTSPVYEDPAACPSAPCPADLSGNGQVDFADILVVIGSWGPCPAGPCPADLSGNNQVDFADILIVIGSWGPCPKIISGACCLIDGSCVDESIFGCQALGGIYRGDATSCAIDFCAPDCNGNGIPDPEDVARGTSNDCNLDEIPDECQDCDGNGIADSCEPFSDCNNNHVPDSCESDCNSNGIPDECDISGGAADDCNGNGVPDSCEINAADALDTDCNGNGVPDRCDIASGVSTDCNENGLPDECEDDCNDNGTTDDCDIESGISLDCNDNGIPDECEPDCNGNGQPDDCDIAFGLAFDCNENGSPDSCDIASGASRDLLPLPNGIPDECEGPGPIVSPYDLWQSIQPTEPDPVPSFDDFSAQPIPADFFGPGSLPFDGQICLSGRALDPQNLGTADTIIQRANDPFQPSDPPGPLVALVPIQIVALSLESCEPIIVLSDSGSTTWDVRVDLSDVPAPPGLMQATKTHPNGGFFDSSLPVQPRFVFRRTDDPSDVRILDTGLEGMPPATLQASGTPWVHNTDPALNVASDPASSFVPGVEEDPKTEEQIRVPIEEIEKLIRHGIIPPCIVTVDLDIWNGLDGACVGCARGPCGGQAVPDAVEETRGAVTVANLNDTDGDKKVDKDDATVAVAGANPPGRNEVDLMKIVLQKPVPDFGGMVTLSKTGGDIKVWEMPTKVTEVVLPKMYPTAALPKTLWVEARAPSPALRDIVLELTYLGKKDVVKATGAWSTRSLVKKDRADPALPGDAGAPMTAIIMARRAADGSRYGYGTMGPQNGAGNDTRVGGRILWEFLTLPNMVEGLGVRWDVTRQIEGRDRRIADGTAAIVAIAGLPDICFPEEETPPRDNETPNDDNGRTDEDNTPANQHIYSFDAPAGGLGATDAFQIRRCHFREWTRVRIDPKGAYVNRNGCVEGSRSSLKDPWHFIEYIRRGPNDQWVSDKMNPSASTPRAGGGNAGNGTIAVAVFGGAITEGFTVTYNAAAQRWTLTGTSGDTVMVAHGGAIPAGTKWVLMLGTKVKVTITQGAVAFAGGDSFTFSTFKSTAIGGKQQTINCGDADVKTGP